MANSLGPKLPQDLFRRLSEERDTSTQRVIVFTTVDEDGFPRHAMLSRNELVARDETTMLMLTYENSRSTRNLLREGIVTLLFIDEEMSYYVRAKCERVGGGRLVGAPLETIFRVKVVDVVEDRLASATITSGIKFSGYDPGMTKEEREIVRSNLFRTSIHQP